ncbi:MAG: precorrin-3B C(17)-methyltransferase [Thermosynechococcaceae cyanobacterium]
MSFLSSASLCQPLAAIAVTPRAAARLAPVCDALGATLWVPAALGHLDRVQTYEGHLKDHLPTLWDNHQGLIFGLACGAVVRLIAPLLGHKSVDPAVVVVDEPGQYAISLCSGHLGGADILARTIATVLQGTPILTGASAAAQLPSLDNLGTPFGWRRGQGDWNRVSAVIAASKPVWVQQDAGSSIWQQTVGSDSPYELTPNRSEAAVRMTARKTSAADPMPTVDWHPRVLWVGIGCERGTAQAVIQQALDQVMAQHGLAPEAIAGLATLDLKADEIGLLAVRDAQSWPLMFYTAAELQACSVPHPSDAVAAAVGTPSVAEAAALMAAAQVAPALESKPPTLVVPKQVLRFPPEPGAVTVAIAQAQIEYLDRPGQLWLVGSGPGDLAQMTPAAQQAIVQADAVIGYSLYLDLLRSRFRPGQLIEASPITQERHRAQRAIALAQWGLTVAVVSSGDAGIYGMAGLVLEELQAQQWDGETPGVQVFPGVSALQAAASRVGTPLMHDFCAISLSDHLTPWPVIEQRLEAAAAADFVVALYNPRSQVRTEQLNQAQQIFLNHRAGSTPVALVRAAYRSEEETTLATLDQLHTLPVDMLTTVIIGNQSTRRYRQWMITPRGYLGFMPPEHRNDK